MALLHLFLAIFRAIGATLRLFLLVLSSALIQFSPSFAQVGIGFDSAGAYQGTIGFNKGSVSAYTCPSGTILRGLYHVDKSMNVSGASWPARGMTSQVGLYCAEMTVAENGTIALRNITPNGTPTTLGAAYNQPGTQEHGYCANGSVVTRLGGGQRQTQNVPWASYLDMYCHAPQIGAGAWVEFNVGNTSPIQVGVNEPSIPHTTAGPFCGEINAAEKYAAVSGIHRQAGGEGYDGINVYCSSIVQARHSAYLTFNNYAWSKVLGGAGWRVSLTQNNAVMSGATDLVPHASQSANDPSTFTGGTEVYVKPNSNYGAIISAKPAGTIDAAYVLTDNCSPGITLANLEDKSCGMTITGRPDLAVHIDTPANAYETKGQTQPVSLRVVNMGPANVNPTWGYGFEVTLPIGWDITSAMPNGCSVSGQVLTCQVNQSLAGAASPGAEGGEIAYVMDFTTNNSVVAGSYLANMRLLRTVPDNSGALIRIDYDVSNDTDSDYLIYLPEPSLILAKITTGGVGSFNFAFPSSASASDSVTLTTTAPNTRVDGPGHGLVPGQDVRVVETTPLGELWRMSGVACILNDTGETLSITTDLANGSFTIPGNIIENENDIFCTVSNEKQTVVTTKSSDIPQGGGVLRGDEITYTLTTVITGYEASSDIVLVDTLSPGLEFIEVVSQLPAGSFSHQDGGANQTFTLAQGTQPGTYQISYSARVTAAASGSVNNAVVSNVGSCDNCTTTNPVITIITNKTSTLGNGESVQAGEQVTFKVTTIVSGGPTSQDLRLTDTLGAGLTFQAVIETEGFIPEAVVGNQLSATLPAGSPAGIYFATYVTTVDENARGTVANSVVPSLGECGTCVVEHPVVQIRTDKSSDIPDTTSISTGQVIPYTLTVTVQDGNTVAPLVLTDTLDIHLAYVGVVPGSPFTESTSTNADGQTVVTFVLPAGQPPGVYSVKYEARLLSEEAEFVKNSVIPSDGDCGICETITNVQGVFVTKTANYVDQTAVQRGDVIDYTIVVDVQSINPTSSDITITDTLGAGLEFVVGSEEGEGFTLTDVTGNTLTFTLAAGARAGENILTYSARVLEAGSVSRVENNVVPSEGECTDCIVSNPVISATTTKSNNLLAGQSVYAGQVVTYAIATVILADTTTQNPTAATTNAITVTDILGPGLEYVPNSAIGAFVLKSVTENPGDNTTTLVFELAAGAPIGRHVVTYDARVSDDATLSSVSNSAYSDYGTCDVNNPCVVTNPISYVASSKSAVPLPSTSVVAGDVITYTVSVVVSGSETGFDVVITDTLSTGLVVVDNSFSTSSPFVAQVVNPQEVTLTLPAGTPVGTHEISYQAQVTTDATVTVNNAILPNIGSCEDCSVTHPVSGVEINKSASPAPGTPVRAGDEITYSISVEVTGAPTTQDVVMRDTLGAGLSYKEGSDTGDAFEVTFDGSQTLDIVLAAPLDPGTYTLTYKATVDTDAAVAVANDVVVDSGGNCGEVCTVINPVTGIDVAKTTTLAPGTVVMEDDIITYNITVTVTNAATSKPVILTDTLGEGLEFIEGSVNGVGFTSDTDAAPELSFTLVAPAQIGTHTVSYNARVLNTAKTAVENSVIGEDPLPICDPDCSVSTPVSTVKVNKATNLALDATVSPGDLITYTITVSVFDEPTSKDIVLTDTLGPGLDFVPNSQSSTSFDTDADAAPVLVFTLPAGAAVGDHTVSYTAIVNNDAVDEVKNAVVTEIGECETCEVIHPVSGVWVNKSALPAAGTSVRAGEEIFYTITVEVEGADTVKPVEITDTIGAGLTYVANSAQGNDFIIDDSDAPILRFTLPTGTQGGEDYTITYSARVDADARVSVSNNVEVESGGQCGDDCVVTNPVSGLEVLKFNNLDPGSVVMDQDVLTYTIQVTVTDAPTAKPVILTDTLGEGLEFSEGSVTGNGFSWDTSAAPTLVFTLEAPAQPGVYEVTYDAKVVQTSVVSVDNVVVPETDLPICEESCETTNPVSRLSTVKTSNQPENAVVWIGDEITYTLTTTVEGAPTTKDLVLTDTLGDGLTYVSGPGPETDFIADTTGAPVLTFTLPAGAPIGTHSVSYTVVVNENVAQSQQDDVANSVFANVGICPIDSCLIVIPVNPPDMDIEIIKTADIQVIRRGEQAPFTIRALNKGEYTARDVRVVDTIPAGFRYVENSSTVDGVAQEPLIVGRQLIYEGLQIPAGSESVIRLRLLALSTAAPGKHVNVAIATNPDGEPVSPPGRAEFEILVEPVFDCGDVIGKVFDDRNRNGYQDSGEPGLTGVRVVTAKGWVITTDTHGRWHVPCAMLPEQRIGSNFIAKIDERSLPTGYRLTTENPRVMRLTAGKLSTIDFGAAITRVVRVDLQNNAFVADQSSLKPEWNVELKELISLLRADISVLRLSYYATAADLHLAKARLQSMRENIVSLWRQSGAPYRLEIESSIEASK